MLMVMITGCFDPNARLPSHPPPGDSAGGDTADSAADTGAPDSGDTAATDTGDDSGAETGDTAPDPVVIAIDLVDPAIGSIDGGTAVILYGGPFAADVAVTFGSMAATVTGWSDTTVDVVTPPGDVGLVDVHAVTAEGSGSAINGYTYAKFCDGAVADPATYYVADWYAAATVTVSLSGCATNITAQHQCPLGSSTTEGWFLTSVPTAVDGTGTATFSVSPFAYGAGWGTGIDYLCYFELGSDQGTIYFTGIFII